MQVSPHQHLLVICRVALLKLLELFPHCKRHVIPSCAAFQLCWNSAHLGLGWTRQVILERILRIIGRDGVGARHLDQALSAASAGGGRPFDDWFSLSVQLFSADTVTVVQGSTEIVIDPQIHALCRPFRCQQNRRRDGLFHAPASKRRRTRWDRGSWSCRRWIVAQLEMA